MSIRIASIATLFCLAPLTLHAEDVDWSGGFAGLGYAADYGSIRFTPGFGFNIKTGQTPAAFGGYQWQTGNFVYGGEVAFNIVRNSPVVGFAGVSEMTSMTDYKLRLGYAIDDVLTYGVVGYANGTYSNHIPLDEHWTVDGPSFGFGVDYAIQDGWRLGAEYLTRNLSAEDPYTSNPIPQTVKIEFHSISLRLSRSF